MSDPVGRYLNKYGKGGQQGNDPVQRYLDRYGQGKPTVEAPADEGTPEESIQTKLLGALVGGGKAVLETVKGTADFANELTKPLADAMQLNKPITEPIKSPNFAEDTRRSVDLIKSLVTAPFQMIGHGAKELAQGQTTEEKVHGGVTAGLGALGIYGGLKGISEFRGKLAEPPGTEAPKQAEATPAVKEEATLKQREAELEKLRVQGEQTAAAQKARKAALLAAANVWNGLTSEARTKLFEGHAKTDYGKPWRELPKETRQAIIGQLAKEKEAAAALEEPVAQGEKGKAVEGEVPAPSTEVAPEQSAPPSPMLDKDVPPEIWRGLDEPAKQALVAQGYKPPAEGVVGSIEPTVPVTNLGQGTEGKVVGEIKPPAAEDLIAKPRPRSPIDVKVGDKMPAGEVRGIRLKPGQDPKFIVMTEGGKLKEMTREQLNVGAVVDKTTGKPKAETGPSADAPREVEGMSIDELYTEQKKVATTLARIALDESHGTSFAKGVEFEKQHAQQYLDDINAQLKARGAETVKPEPGERLNEYGLPVGVSRYDVRPMPGSSDQVLVHVYDEHGNISETHGPISRTEAKAKFPYAKVPDAVDLGPGTKRSTPEEMNAEIARREAAGEVVKGTDEQIVEEQRTRQADTEELLNMADRGEEAQATKEAIDQVTEPQAPPDVAAAIEDVTKVEDPRVVERVVKIKQQLRFAEARAKARDARRGLWKDKTPDQIAKSVERDKKLVEDLNKELADLTPRLTEAQRTQLADRAETRAAVEGKLDKQMKDLGATRSEKPAGISEPIPSPPPEPTPPSSEAPPSTPGGAVGGAAQKPKARFTAEELDKAMDLLDEQREAGKITPAQYAQGVREVIAQKKLLKAEGKAPAPQSVQRDKFKMPDTVGKDLTKFTQEQLDMTKRSIAALLRSPDIQNLPESAILKAEIDRILDYENAKDGGPRGPGLAIFDVSERKAIKKRAEEGLSETEKYFAEKVALEPDLNNPLNWVKKIRQLYQSTMRPSHAVNVANRLYEGATGEVTPAHQNPGKIMEMMDGSLTEAESFLRGDGPHIPDGAGGTVPTGTPSLAAILERIGGDVEQMGWLWAARRALELKAIKNKSIGIDLAKAQDMYLKASDEMHQAVDQARAYNYDLARYGNAEGLVSNEALKAFAEETSYGPIERIFNEQQLLARMADEINLRGKKPEALLGTQPFQRLKGGTMQIRNMVEATMHATYRILKLAKQNRFALELVDKAKEQPDLFRGIVTPLGHKQTLAMMADMTARAKAVKAIFADQGMDITLDRANFWANMITDDALTAKGGVLRVWRDGKIELWKVDDMLTDSIKSMSKNELPWIINMLGKPARPLRLGVVLDPMFIANQLMIDQLQGWMNTKYGFRPVLDSFMGWYNIMKETPEFKEALRAGGIEKGQLRTRTGLTEILAGPSAPPLELATKEIRALHPLKALNVMLTPIREATRMGEYLRARKAGATPMEAAWAARDLLGNYSLQGTSLTIRALNHMSAFSGPALAVLDKTGRAIKDNPKQWFARGALVLGSAAAALYAANYGDEEIDRLRQTPDGQRWFFFRIGDKIYKWRKSYLEGAIFASGVEAALDQWNGKNPEAFQLWLRSMRNEAALNFLPVAGVVPAEVYFNKRLSTGGPIVSDEELGLDPEYQTGNYSGTAERVVGRATGTSPAIINHVVRGFGGYLGESAVRSISAAIDYNTTQELPAVEDLPFTQRLFGRYPSGNTRPIMEFYENAQVVEQAANSIAEAERSHPEDLERKLLEHEEQLPLIELYNDARKQIADLRRSAEALDGIKDIGPQTKKAYRDVFLRQIIDIADATNSVAREIKNQQPQAAKP